MGAGVAESLDASLGEPLAAVAVPTVEADRINLAVGRVDARPLDPAFGVELEAHDACLIDAIDLLQHEVV